MKTLLRIILLSSIVFTGCKPTEHTISTHTENTVIKYRDTTFVKAADTTEGKLNIDSIFRVFNSKNKQSVINKTFYLKDTSGRVELRQYMDSLGILHQTLIANEVKFNARLQEVSKVITDNKVVVREKTFWEKLKDQWLLYVLILIVVIIQAIKIVK